MGSSSNQFCGILLAGGTGSRLAPLTSAFSKHFLPVYNKPLFYYSLSSLMLAGVRRILVICTDRDEALFREYFGRHKNFGLHLTFLVQERPVGLPDAFRIGESFIGEDDVVMALGDNIFFGAGFQDFVSHVKTSLNGASVIGVKVSDASRFGVVEVNEKNRILSIEEKPHAPKSNIAISGLYFFDNTVCKRTKTLKISKRGELEIVDLLKSYLVDDKLSAHVLGRGTAWFDAGTSESLKQAGDFIESVETRQGILVSSPEEIALNRGWLAPQELREITMKMGKSAYSTSLKSLLS